MSESCNHDDLEIGSMVDVMRDQAGKPYLLARLNVRCSGCRTLFSWRGIGAGIPNAIEPVVSADGYEVRMPIQPGPGATVGLLIRAGLEDRLMHPNQLNQENSGEQIDQTDV